MNLMYGITTLPTGISPDRLAMLIAYSWMMSEKPGAFAEFGVCQGGSLDLLSRLHPDRLIYGIDSFEGLPQGGPMDTYHTTPGEFALSEKELNNIIDYFWEKNVLLFKGFSPEVFNSIPKEDYSFVHVDVDLYQSVKDALDYFYPCLINTGIMIFDDYGFPTTPGAKQAIDEFSGRCTYRGEIVFNNGHKSGQYIIIK
jgi:O-methyltransferase